MKFAMVLYIGIISTVYLSAQPALNNVYGALTANWGSAVIPEQNGYFIAGSGYSVQIDSFFSIKLLRVDSLGNLLWEKDYGQQNYKYQVGATGGSCKKIDEEGYVVPGYALNGMNIYSGLVMRVDSQGNNVWTDTFTLGGFTLFNDCVITPGKGIIAVGETTGLGDTTGDVYLVKLDSAGNFLWQKKYGGNQEDDGLSIALLADGGFIIGGLTYSFGPGIISNYLIRTDSSGNQIWSRMYGIVDGLNGGCQAFPANGGGYLMCGLWDTIANNGDGGASYVARLDTDGNIKWMVFFDDSISIDQDRELANNDIIVAGQKQEPPSIDPFYGGYLAKMDSDGNILWQEILQYNGALLASAYANGILGSFYDVQSTQDSGFVLTGTSNFNDTSGGQIQEIWLVKTDSTGCLDSCSKVGIEQVKALNEDLKIYPNPAYSTVTIEWQPMAALEATVAIYDVVGREISSQQINSGKAQINVSGLEDGLYVVKVMSPSGGGGGGGIFSSAKLAVLK